MSQQSGSKKEFPTAFRGPNAKDHMQEESIDRRPDVHDTKTDTVLAPAKHRYQKSQMGHRLLASSTFELRERYYYEPPGFRDTLPVSRDRCEELQTEFEEEGRGKELDWKTGTLDSFI